MTTTTKTGRAYPTPAEVEWLRKLAEYGTYADIRADALERLAEIESDGVDAAALRSARVHAWATTCGDAHAMEHAPGGLAATSHEIATARRVHGGWARVANGVPEHGALWHACLYAAPAPPPIYFGTPSAEACEAATQDAVRTLLCQQYHMKPEARKPRRTNSS
ncbi:MAG: hypothetical protein E6Q97_07815 [Desulfurellales bacterium]|nr:MAG: hypothetical protein E6Q97_07815 [Desulfurellales bacterium]